MNSLFNKTSSQKPSNSFSKVIEQVHQWDYEKIDKSLENNILKEDIGGLEKWFNDQKIKIMSNENEKNYMAEAKNQIMKKRLENEKEKSRNYEEPLLNQNLLNFSLFDKNFESHLENEKIKEFARNKDRKLKFDNIPSDKSDKKYEPIKSMDSIKDEYRKQILNQIIVDKLIKQKKMKNTITSSPDEIKTLMTTLPNFKCLQNSKKTNAENLIQMDYLREKLMEFQQKPHKNFEFGIYEEQFHKITNDLKSLEEILLEKFNEISDELHKKKLLGQTHRNIHANLAFTIKRLNDEKDVLLGKFNTIEQRIINSMSDKNDNHSKQNKPKNQITTEFIRLEKFRGEKSDQEKKVLRNIMKIQTEIDQNKNQINEINQEIKNLNFKKMNVKFHLREIYHKMLKSDDDSLKENGLVWIIKSFWHINEEIPFDIFPKIIDHENFIFLLEYCKLDLEIFSQSESLRQKQKEYTHRKLFKKYLNNREKEYDFHQRINKSQIDEKLFDLKKNFMNTHLISSSKISHTLADNITKNRQRNFYSTDQTTSYNENYKNYKSLNETDISNKNLMILQNQSEEMKIEEINRMINIFKDKSNEDKTLKEKIEYIFGKIDSNQIFENYLQKMTKKMPNKLSKKELSEKFSNFDETEKIKGNFQKLKNQIFHPHNLPDYNNSYLFFK